MPEAPEVQVVVNSLRDRIVGYVINDVSFHGDGVVMSKYDTPQKFKERVTGLRVTDVGRRGKYILIKGVKDQTSETYVIIAHLAMVGAILVLEDGETRYNVSNAIKSGIHTIFSLTDEEGTPQKHTIAFSDYRKFGSLKAVAEAMFSNPLSAIPSHLHGLIKLGADPLQDTSDEAVERFITAIRKKKYTHRPIKNVLLDQEVVAGVGNIYASEICWVCKINPHQPVGTIGDDALKRIYHELHLLFSRSVQAGGSSIKDFIDVYGKRGTTQETVLSVFGKKNCTCGESIESFEVAGRTTYSCRVCQPYKQSVT